MTGDLVQDVLPRVPAVLYLSTPPPERRLLHVTEGWEELVGQEATSGRSLSTLVHPDDRERVEVEIREALADSGSYSVFYRMAEEGDGGPSKPGLMREGRSRWVWDRGHVAGEGEGVASAGEDGATDRVDVAMDDEGAGADEASRLRGILLDITELKSVEQRAVQGQRKEALGALAGSVAQEFNDLLTAIYGSLDFALEQNEDPRTVKDELQVAVQSVKRARFLTEQLVSFTRARPQRPRVENPNALVEEMKPFIESVAGSRVRTVVALDPRASEARFDPSVLEQAIMNLVLNAREAMEGERGGRLLVSTEDVVFEGDDLRRGDEVRPGRYSTISVSDTGPGVPEDVRHRIYEPFFTTKEGHSGLGLSATFGIVRQMGGIVRLRSTQGKGTRATIFLPAAEAAAVARLDAAGAAGGAGRGEAGVAAEDAEPVDAAVVAAVDAAGTGEESGSVPAERGEAEATPRARILLVEDDDAVRRLLTRILERKAYEVVAVPLAEEALEIARDPDREFDLLFTDVMMPGMRGPELVRRVRPLQPRARVVVTSGFPNDDELTEGGLPEEVVFLGKPFSVWEVFDAVEEALGREVGPVAESRVAEAE